MLEPGGGEDRPPQVGEDRGGLGQAHPAEAHPGRQAELEGELPGAGAGAQAGQAGQGDRREPGLGVAAVLLSHQGEGCHAHECDDWV